MIIQVYTPTTDVEEEKDNKFYEQGQFEIDWTCRQDVLFAVEDLNINVGSIEEESVVEFNGFFISNNLKQPKWWL